MSDFNLQAPWVGNPPDEEEPACKCTWCGEPLYEGDEVYEIDGDILCEECAYEWLHDHRINLE